MGDVARLIRRRIVWVVLAALAAALTAALVTAFGYNRAHEAYFLTFVVEFAQADTPFRYETVVYADNLDAAKESDAAFSAIDTERMATHEDIGIVRAGGETQHPAYTVTVLRRYFADRQQATKFLKAMVSHAVVRAENAYAQTPRLLPSFPHLWGSAHVRRCADMQGTPRESTAHIMYRQNVVSATGGGRSPFLMAAVAFLLTFLAAGGIVCAAEYPREKRVRMLAPPTDGAAE